MERRYGRANRKYRAKINKEEKKLPLEKLILRQSALCAMLFAVGVLFSYADFTNEHKESISAFLYKSNTLSQWQATFAPAVKAAKKCTQRTAEAISKGAEICEKKLKLDKTSGSGSPVNAKAKDEPQKKSQKADKSDKLKSETENEPSAEKSSEEGSEKNTENPKQTPEWRIPTSGEISSVFGSRVHPISGEVITHTGIDIAAPYGQTVIAAMEGTVTAVGEDSANGKYVTVKHSDSISTVYAHLSKICVSEGEKADSNTKIGEVGTSGVSTGPHLHFEVKLNKESVNPENYITLPHREGV